jgi:mono/diheme cytochrome c family protein
MRTRARFVAAVSLLLLLVACGTARRGEPAGPKVAVDSAHEARGEQLFFRNCSPCHPGGEAGLGPAINDKPLPELAIKTQIRAGVGAMPAFSEEELSDRDMDAIVEYIEEMRDTPATHARAD